MGSLQVLHNKAAIFVLNLPNRESSTKALTHLRWRPLSYERSTDVLLCIALFSLKKGENQFNFPNLQGQDYRKYNTQRQAEVCTAIMQDQLGQKSILVSFF